MGTCGSGCSACGCAGEVGHGDGTECNPFRLKQGTTYDLVFRVTRNGRTEDLTDRVGRAQIRRQADDVGAPVLGIDLTIPAQVGRDRGRATGRIPADVTAPTAITRIPPGFYVMDAEFTLPDDPSDIITTETTYLIFAPKVTK